MPFSNSLHLSILNACFVSCGGSLGFNSFTSLFTTRAVLMLQGDYCQIAIHNFKHGIESRHHDATTYALVSSNGRNESVTESLLSESKQTYTIYHYVANMKERHLSSFYLLLRSTFKSQSSS